VNRACLDAVALLSRDLGDATLTVDDGTRRRTLLVSRGQLVGSESTAAEDRLGALLVARGSLEAARVERAASTARVENRLLGEQLVKDGLMGQDALARALELQAVTRFERALLMGGTVVTTPVARFDAPFRRALSELMVQAFRQAVPWLEVQALLAQRTGTAPRVADQPPPLADLGLTQDELELWLKLRGGRQTAELLQNEPAARFLAALWVLGALAV
jgi:hypothetical protein